MPGDDIFEPNKTKNIAVFAIAVCMVCVSVWLRHWNGLGGVIQTFFYLPILFILLGIAYFIKQKSGKWHTLFLIFTGVFCLWILRIFIQIGIVQTIKFLLRALK